jgi:predicted nucleic acid-binding protein
MNAVKTFIDTNVLIYAFTADEPEKRAIAIDCLNNCLPVISTQVVKELSAVLLKKAKIDLSTLRDTVGEIAEVAEVVHEEIALVFSAFDIHEKYQFSFYDSLIIAAALQAKCQVLLSEDMQDGQIVNDELTIVNPYKTQ